MTGVLVERTVITSHRHRHCISRSSVFSCAIVEERRVIYTYRVEHTHTYTHAHLHTPLHRPQPLAVFHTQQQQQQQPKRTTSRLRAHDLRAILKCAASIRGATTFRSGCFHRAPARTTRVCEIVRSLRGRRVCPTPATTTTTSPSSPPPPAAQ